MITIGLVFLFCVFFYHYPSPNDIFVNNIPCVVEVKAYDEHGESYGTGFYFKEDNYLLTNYHIISYSSGSETNEFQNIAIRAAAEENYNKVYIVKKDINIDLVVLKLDNKEYNNIKIKLSDDTYSFGDDVYAIGNTSNQGIGISKGIISIPEVEIEYNKIVRKMIQVDINVANGNSGGPLLNSKGHLIGITTFRTRDFSGSVNYGFVYSIPINVIKDFIKGV